MINRDKTIQQLIKSVLQNDSRLWYSEHDNQGELNQTLLIDLVEKYDTTILALLLANPTLKAKFFTDINGIMVFKTNDFRFFIEENKINNSFTNYKNRIGLTDGKYFLKDTQDVVLNFPYKDCVLEGGQSSEEGEDVYFEYDEKVTATNAKKGHQANSYNQKTAKRKEIFFNEILAQDEIDRLLDKKAFVNWQKFSKDGTETPTQFNRNLEGTITDNLIIKGNNLLALHTLKSEFAGKVKLIYIDPPYYFKDRKQKDAFAYNSNFHLSTWLTFIKNRLEIAKQLLSEDGVIFISIDDDGMAYLKVLCDQIFNKDSFIACLPRLTKKAGKSTDNISKNHDYVLLYSKNHVSLNQSEIDEDDYKHKDEYFDTRGSYKLNQTLDYSSIQYSASLDYEIEIDNQIFRAGNVSEEEMRQRQVKNPKSDYCWRWSKELFEFGLKNGFIVVKNSKNGTRIYTKTYTKARIPKKKPYQIEYFERTKNVTSLDFYFLQEQELDFVDNQYSNDMARKNIQSVFDENVFEYSKPENLLKRIIEISTNPDDLVLDFHLGSGTTCAVAHKMGRQYIGIEQMDYIETITIERMKKVIDGEQGGISKSVEWKGGGEFIYCELAEYNQQARKLIAECNNFDELKTLFNDEFYQQYFLHYNIKTKEFVEKTINEENFANLSLDEHKKIFIAMLDNNQLYVNYTEIDDEKFAISDTDKALTHAFYSNDKDSNDKDSEEGE